ncbi:MAG: uncharacterized protein KVP18_001685 [Porospora cf. gigantea A]|nr:MAG: hypothetical protein KVP18_001685 [Porospora cf. gigantea A]
MIGDNLLTDIAFGQLHCRASLMVLSGVSTQAQADAVRERTPELAPTFIAPGLSSMVENVGKTIDGDW